LKPLVCIYCEGNDTKIAVVIKEKEKIKVLKTTSFDVIQPSLDIEDGGLSSLNIDGEDLELDKINKGDSTSAQASQTLIISSLKGINLNNSLFLPALTEPAIYYHIFEGTKQGKESKLTQEIIFDIQETKNVKISKENLGYIELSDKSILSVFLSGEVQCINMINSLARFNGKRFYKIPAVKSAEISLAYYIAKRKKFFPDDNSLIVYIGKEYSKLIFLQGRKLKHIGSTLDIGTLNLHTYDVYFSKILLEMENGGISSLDNIIVCGEDDSENLILSFYGTFPEANVSKLEFDDLDLSDLDDKTKEIISSYSVPVAIANDYFDGLENLHKGINLLPKYVKEDQKFFQFAWHGYAMLPFLFIASLLITYWMLKNQKEINYLDTQIAGKTILQRQHQKILSRIADIQNKISGFDQTQAILDSASTGSGVWSVVMSKISGFISSSPNLWLTKLTKEEGDQVVLEGYSLNKNVLTDFAYYLENAQLKSVHYEAILEKNTYRFSIAFNISGYYQYTQ
jgi:Tfp pilus assembly protein PilN